MKILVALLFILLQSCTFAQDTDENNKLVIPPLLSFEMKSGTKEFVLEPKNSTHNFSSDIQSIKTMSYNDMTYLGPTIRVRNNDKIHLQVKNELKVSTTLHQHGLHLPSMADGNIFQVISPGDDWTADYTVKQQAGTYWYHPHKNEETGYQVSMGLSGLLIVDDDIQDALDLPHEYGVDDIPLIIQDKNFSKKKIAYSDSMNNSFFGNIGKTVVTNGSVNPNFLASSALIRLRILNGSSFGIHKYFFKDKRKFYLIANDGGLLDKPYLLSEIELAPSERREILVDISDLKKNDVLAFMTEVRGSLETEALTIIADNFNNRNTKVPATLVPYPEIKNYASNIDAEKEFIFYTYDDNGSMHDGMMGNMHRKDRVTESDTYLSLSINGVRLDPEVVNVKVDLDSKEKWIVSNPKLNTHMDDLVHSMHPHSGSFLIASINGQLPEPNQRGWKDTIMLDPGDKVEIIMKFEDYTGKYLYHCHQLEHEDYGMMGVFEVVETSN